MNTRFAFILAALLALIASPPASAAPELHLGVSSNQSRERQIGEHVRLPLSINYADLPAEARIYAFLLPVAGNAWALEGGGTLTAQKPSVNFTGNFASGDPGPFMIGPGSFPVSILIKKDALAKMLGAFAGADAGTDLADGLSNTPDGLRLNFAFLTAASGDAGMAESVLEFTVPDYPVYYDGVEIVPFVVTFQPDGTQKISLDGKTMTSVRLPVRPNRPRAPANDSSSKSNATVPGVATIVGEPSLGTTVQVGQMKTLNLSIRYRELLPNTAIYVAPVAVADGSMVATVNGSTMKMSMDGMSLTSKVHFIDGPTPLYAIPKDDEPIELSPMGVPMEAALVGVARNPSGILSGTISFRPPPYLVNYRRIRLIPILVSPTSDGMRMRLDTAQFGEINVAVGN